MSKTTKTGQLDSHLQNDGRLTALRRRIAFKRGLAQWAMMAERVWIAALPLLGVASLYLILSWFGFFRQMPDLVRYGALGALVVAGLASLLSFRGVKLPRAQEAEERIEINSGLAHQAIRVMGDKPTGHDPYGDILWHAHQTRMAEKVKGLDAGMPSPDIARHDPLAIRALVVCLLFVGWGFSFSGSGGTIRDAFVPTMKTSNLAAGTRIDAWVTPPAYTGRAPVFLLMDNPQDVETISVPQFSELTVRLSGEDRALDYIAAKDGQPIALQKTDGPAKTSQASSQTESRLAAHGYRLKLEQDGTFQLGEKSFAFNLVKDKVPEIAYDKEPSATVNGALEISFAAKDDYGVTEAHAEIVPLESDAGAVTLYDLPEYRLDIPGSGKGEIKAVSSRDLTKHPLSGKKVRMTLVATDALGQIGRSEPRDIILPARPFSEPLAASIAEQRQVFSLDVRKVRRALDLNAASTLRPEETIENLSHYLLVQSAANRLKLSRNPATLKETADYFWDIARGIEDGDLSVAEKNLKNAQQALADALKRNAPDAEIQKLMKELRQAMQDYLAELAKRNQQDGKQQNSEMARNVIRSQDLQKMLDQLENLARSGARDEAQKLLNDMQRLMNNLNTARPRDGNNDRNNPVRQQIDRLGQILQDQEKLMEETHKLEQALRDRQQRGDPLNPDDGLSPLEDPFGEDGMNMPDRQPNGDEQAQDGQQPGEKDASPFDKMTAEQLKQALSDLKKRQDELEKGVGELQKKLSELGMKPVPGFGEGKKEMKNAAGALGKSEGQRALDSQGRALEALRKGAGDMMQQIMQAGGRGRGGNQPGGPGQGTAGRDPLGRQANQLGEETDGMVKVPDEIDIQRAREILEAIRKRLSDGNGGMIERNYLERLLDLKP